MDDFIDYISTETANILMTFFMAGMLLAGGILVFLIWKMIQSGMEEAEHQNLLREAQSIFDRVRDENLPELQIDPMLHSIFGQEIDLQPAGVDDPGDWLSKALYGVG